MQYLHFFQKTFHGLTNDRYKKPVSKNIKNFTIYYNLKYIIVFLFKIEDLNSFYKLYNKANKSDELY